MQSLAKQYRPWGRVASTLSVLIGAAIGAGAQALGPEIPIWLNDSASRHPRVAFDEDHEVFLVVWSNSPDLGTVDVSARTVGLDGDLGIHFPVVSIADEVHQYPVLAYNSNHAEYLVAWEHWVPFTAADYDVLGSLVSWDGATIGNPFLIVSGFEAHVGPDVASNPNDDEYLVVSLNAGPGWRDIHARRLDGNGTPVGSAIVTTSGNDGVGPPHAAFSPEIDAYLIGYGHQSPSTGHRTAVGKIAAPNLSGVGSAPEIVIVDDPAEDVRFPVVGGSTGGFVAVFNLSASTRARRLAIDGTPVGPASGFPLGFQNNQTILGSTRPNAVSRADAVGYVAAWHQLTPTDGDVYAQALSATSDCVVSGTFTVSGSSADEREVDIACAAWGTCLIVYQRDENIVGRTLRLRVFSDGFETGDPGAWSNVLMDGCDAHNP